MWGDYGDALERKLADPHDRIHRRRTGRNPSRRQYIAKARRPPPPARIATLEDKIVQRAIVEVLNSIYEEDFLGPQAPSLAFAGVTVEGLR